MGLFTSNCPECNAEIHWFLKVPENFVCACGRPVSEDEIELSNFRNYAGHIKDKCLTRWLSDEHKAELSAELVSLGEPQDTLEFHKLVLKLCNKYLSQR